MSYSIPSIIPSLQRNWGLSPGYLPTPHRGNLLECPQIGQPHQFPLPVYRRVLTDRVTRRSMQQIEPRRRIRLQYQLMPHRYQPQVPNQLLCQFLNYQQVPLRNQLFVRRLSRLQGQRICPDVNRLDNLPINQRGHRCVNQVRTL